MRRDGSEIIEVFDTDDALFADVPAADTDTDDAVFAEARERQPRRPRWSVPAGLTAALAVAAVVATTGSGDDDLAQRAAATTTAAVTTTPITLATLPSTTITIGDAGDPATSDGLRMMPRYSTSLPTDYAVVVANSGEVSQTQPIRSQLWATPGSSRSVGRWVAITAGRPRPLDDGVQLAPQNNSYRVDVNGAPGIVTLPLAADGSIEMLVFRDDATLYIQAFGVTPDFLVAEAGSVGVGPTPTLELTHSLGIFDEFRMIADAATYWQSSTRPGMQSRLYAAQQAPLDAWSRAPSITVITGRPAAGFTEVLPFIVDSPMPFHAPDGSIGLAGNEGPAAGDPPGTSRATAYWIDRDGWSVTVSTVGSVDDAIELARMSYSTGSAEWEALDDSAPLTFGGERPTVVSAQAITLESGDAQPGDGNTPAGHTVVARLRSSTVGDETRYRWSGEIDDLLSPSVDSPAETTAISGDSASVQVVSSLTRTFVFATVPRGAAGAVVTVYPVDGEPVTAPLADLEPAFGVLGAALTFEQPGAFTAVITGADGAVLAAWPAPAAG